MKNVIITGASGMIGGIILRECLNSDKVSRITSLVRTKSNISHEKLTEVEVKDFNNYQSQIKYFQNQQIAFYGLGVYTGQVDKEKFKEITVDYTRSFASSLQSQSPDCSICFLSGQGADQSGKSKMMFARDKGEAEKILLNCQFPRTYIFRPAYIYPVKKRKEPNAFYSIIRFLYPVLNQIHPRGAITSEVLGKAMFKAGIDKAHKVILENQDIKEILK